MRLDIIEVARRHCPTVSDRSNSAESPNIPKNITISKGHMTMADDLMTAPSSKKTCPYLGQEFQPFTNPQLEDPYPFYKRARSESPIFYSPLLEAYVLTCYDDIISVLKDTKRFSSADNLQSPGHLTPETVAVLGQGYAKVPDLVNSDGDRHKRLRAPFARVFASDQIKKIEGSIYTVANRLVDGFVNDGRAEIISQFSNALPLEVILIMYGIPLEMMGNVKEWCNDTSALFSSQLTPEQQVKCAQSFVSIQHTFARLIESPDITPENNLIATIRNSDLSINELVIILWGLIVAGHKTTGELISNGLKIMLEQPHMWQALCDDPSLIPTAIEEVLRYEPPLPSMIRTTTEEVEVAGVTLPKGTRIFLMYGSANRDETQYTNADRFEIKRFQHKTSDHLAFGHHAHHCLGSNLARSQARIALEVLSKRLPNLRLRPNQELSHFPSMLSRGYISLEVEWDITS